MEDIHSTSHQKLDVIEGMDKSGENASGNENESSDGKLSSMPELTASASFTVGIGKERDGACTSPGGGGVPVSPSQSASMHTVKDCVIKMLDEMDERVDKLRSEAMKMENERDDILSSMDTLCNAQMVYELEGIELDEVTRYIDRIARRCLAIQVDIKTERSSSQLDGLSKVNSLIDALIRDLKNDVAAARRRCVAYINSCSESCENFYQEIPETDSKFENAVLECTADDQKRVKKRLTGLYSYFNTFGTSPSSIPNSQLGAQFDANDDIDRPFESL